MVGSPSVRFFLPSPRWGEGVGVRGRSPPPSPPTPLPSGARGEESLLLPAFFLQLHFVVVFQPLAALGHEQDILGRNLLLFRGIVQADDFHPVLRPVAEAKHHLELADLADFLLLALVVL